MTRHTDLAARLPVGIVVGRALAMEIGVGYAARDNPTPKVPMLLHPPKTVRHWQAGG